MPTHDAINAPGNSSFNNINEFKVAPIARRSTLSDRSTRSVYSSYPGNSGRSVHSNDSTDSNLSFFKQYAGIQLQIAESDAVEYKEAGLSRFLFERIGHFGTGIRWGRNSGKKEWGTIILPPHFESFRRKPKTQEDIQETTLRLTMKRDDTEPPKILVLKRTFASKRDQEMSVERLRTVPLRQETFVKESRRRAIRNMTRLNQHTPVNTVK